MKERLTLSNKKLFEATTRTQESNRCAELCEKNKQLQTENDRLKKTTQQQQQHSLETLNREKHELRQKNSALEFKVHRLEENFENIRAINKRDLTVLEHIFGFESDTYDVTL